MPTVITAAGNRQLTAASSRAHLLPFVQLMASDSLKSEATLAGIRKAVETVPEVKKRLQDLRLSVREATATEIITWLMELAVHYWTPDLTEEQVTSKFRDFYSDLKGVSPEGIRDACTAWRRSENDFFPKPGQMLALCRDDIRRRAEDQRGLDRLEALLDGKPLQLEDGARGRPLRPIGDILREHGRVRDGDTNSGG